MPLVVTDGRDVGAITLIEALGLIVRGFWRVGGVGVRTPLADMPMKLPSILAGTSGNVGSAHNDLLGFTVGELWWWVGGVSIFVPHME